MAEEDYLADLIKKVKEAKKMEKEAESLKKTQPGKVPQKAVAPARIPEEIESIKEAGPVEAPKVEAPVPETLEEEGPRKSIAEKELEEAPRKKMIDQYGLVKIYTVPGKPLPYYVVPVARPTKQEKAVINTIKEAATRLIAISAYRIRDPTQRRAVYKQRILEILKNSPELHIPTRRFDDYAEFVIREMVGYGIIDPLVMDDDLEEIMVIGAKKPVYIFHRKYEMMSTNIEFYSDKEIIDLINRIARHVGRRVDISAPLLDARMPDGSRVNATIPPASVEGATLTIRKFRKDPYTIIDLLDNNTMTSEVAAFLWLCVDGLGAKPANILISGGTGSGKTTTLNSLASFIPDTERVVSIEDTAELALPLKHWIRMEARLPGLEGKGELTLDILTKNSLRMRPDRIIVGEVRHDEAFTLFTALNTGHDGMASEDALIQLSDGSIRELGTFCEEYFAKLGTKRNNGIEFAELKDCLPEVVAVNKENMKQQTAKVRTVWKRECQKSLALKMASGKEIKLSYDHPVFRLKNGFLEQVQSCECKKGDYLCSLNFIDINGKKYDKEYSYLLGLLLGDGHLRKEGIFFENKNERMHDIFQNLVKKIFGKKAKISKRIDRRMSSRLFSVKAASEIHEKFNIPFGNKTKIFDIPEAIEEADNASVGLFLRGMFDTDGHVSDIRKSVCLATSNNHVARKVPLLLKRFGIESRLNRQEKDGKEHVGPYYRIFITGESNIKKFRNSVGFGDPKKARILKTIIGTKENTNVDVVPHSGTLIKDIRKALGLSKKTLAFKARLGNTGASINAYETKARNPSRDALRKINRVLTSEFNKKIREINTYNLDELCKVILISSNKKAIKTALGFAKKFSTVTKLEEMLGFCSKMVYYYLKTGAPLDKEKLAKAVRLLHYDKMKELAKARWIITHTNSILSNSIRWDKIVGISQKEEKTSYYDLTLDKFNTFVANGLLVSNCMGTIHANSPQETIVRVTSPPMNVPEVMLSGLDFIIIEHKIHDKRKGTIRRITEIAEISGVLLKRAQTQTIFLREPVKDTIERTNIPIKFLKILQDFTGRSRKSIEDEWTRRKIFLEKLQKEGIRGLEDVKKATQEFTLGK